MRVEAKGNLTVTLIRQHTLGVDRLHMAQPVRPAVIEVCPPHRGETCSSSPTDRVDLGAPSAALPTHYAPRPGVAAGVTLTCRLTNTLPPVVPRHSVSLPLESRRPMLLPTIATVDNLLDVLA